MTTTIKLWDLAGAEDDRRFSPHCWRVKMALRHKGLEAGEIPWRFSEKEAIAFSGQGRVPVITEKATNASGHNQVVFRVRLDATKPEIKAAVEGLFNVKVKAVNTLRTKGKEKRFRGRLGRRSNYKKAIVTLKAGEKIVLT